MTPDIPVLIVGGGSVGLSLANELGWRGVPCMVVERAEQLNQHPRANGLANRTMEYFRRWNIAAKISDTGIPSDRPGLYFWVSTMAGRLIHEVRLPPAAHINNNARGAYAVDEYTWSPYLKTTTGQDEVEKILLANVRAQPDVEMLFRTELTAFEDKGDHVLCTLKDCDTGEERHITARYLAGCDGGRSIVRQTSDVKMSGRASLSNFVSIYFRSEEFLDAGKFGHASMFFPLHSDHRGFILNWDGGKTFTYHLILPEGKDWTDIDPVETVRAVVDAPINVKIHSVQPWTAHALTAENYRPSENSFLVGDAAHLFTPTGGFGMNTGVSDAIDLAWKLEAMLKGWGGPNLLDSYHAERRPIGVRNTMAAADCFDELYDTMQNGDELDADTPEADALRARLQASLKEQEKMIVNAGMFLGYRYEGSPIVVPDGTPEPEDHPRRYVVVARPGHRAPHVWLEDETALMDRFGKDFTLLVTDSKALEDGEAFVKALHDRHVPAELLFVDEPKVAQTYAGKMVLIRPDMMVAWRGNQLPADVAAVVDRVIGA